MSRAEFPKCFRCQSLTAGTLHHNGECTGIVICDNCIREAHPQEIRDNDPVSEQWKRVPAVRSYGTESKFPRHHSLPPCLT